MKRMLAAVAAAAMVTAGCSGGSSDQAGDAPYYEGKTIELIAPVGPGGTVDSTARLFAEYLTKYIEGEPTVQVVNIPGGAGIEAGNTFVNRYESDGTALFLATQVAILPYLLGQAAVEYDFADMTPIWAANRGQSVILANEQSGLESAADLFTADRELVVGTISPSGADLPPMLSFEILGLLDGKLRVIQGYEDGDAKRNAFSAGELDIDRIGSAEVAENPDSYETQMYTMGQVAADGSLEADGSLPETPTVADVYEAEFGKAPSGPAWDAFLAMNSALGRGGYSLQVVAEAPDDAKTALDAAIVKVLEDPEFDERIHKLLGDAPNQIVGQEARDWSASVSNTDPETIEWIKGFLEERFGLQF